jgi:general secretion pathway protein F/type IV pilus assembly protein PilC
MAYPIFLAVVGVLVINALIILVVPKFEDLFASLREQGQLPYVTDLLLIFSNIMRRWGVFVAAGIIGLVVVIRQQLATERGQYVRDLIRLKAPGAGKIYLNFAVARFCRILGTLLHGGVPIVRSLKISSDSTGNVLLATAVQKAADSIAQGEPLAGPLGASGYFPKDVVEMISVAEESNTLEQVLTNIANSLEKQTWRQLDLFVKLLEPIMLLLMASVVLVVVIALLVPVMRMGTAV